LFLTSCYFIGFTLLDYNFERHQMTIQESEQFTRKNFGLACGIGFVSSVLLWLPFFIGNILGPIIGVIGATISFLNIKTKSTQNS
jgi:CysZ protein